MLRRACEWTFDKLWCEEKLTPTSLFRAPPINDDGCLDYNLGVFGAAVINLPEMVLESFSYQTVVPLANCMVMCAYSVSFGTGKCRKGHIAKFFAI
uniref:Apple domain-containing protein n=1 Tax=Ascaris lumbricoides TaxID=6252 RepID=A0A0M3HS11_ASCLU